MGGRVWGGAATLALAGCFASSDGPAERAHVDDDAVILRSDPTVSTDPTTGSTTFVDADGRTWSTREVTTFAADAPPTTPAFTGTSYPTETDDQIANDFRAVKLKVGADGTVWEYTEVYAPTTRVSAALAKDRAGVWGYSEIGSNGDPVYIEKPSTTTAMQPIRSRDYAALTSGDPIRRPGVGAAVLPVTMARASDLGHRRDDAVRRARVDPGVPDGCVPRSPTSRATNRHRNRRPHVGYA